MLKRLLVAAAVAMWSTAALAAELAEGYKTEHDLDKAYALFEQAAGDAREFTPKDAKTFELTRALRGMGWVRSEQGRFDDAEKLFRECLQLNPDDAKAKSELDY